MKLYGTHGQPEDNQDRNRHEISPDLHLQNPFPNRDSPGTHKANINHAAQNAKLLFKKIHPVCVSDHFRADEQQQYNNSDLNI